MSQPVARRSIRSDPLHSRRNKEKEIQRYLDCLRNQEVQRDPGWCAFAAEAIPLLNEQLASLDEVDLLLSSLPKLPRQVIHGDFTARNLLWSDDSLSAVVDFRSARPFFAAYELGRLAFSPESVAGNSDWRTNGIAVLEGTAPSSACRRRGSDRLPRVADPVAA